MIAGATGWLGLLAALATVAGLVVRWWLSTRPQRRAKEARDENADIDADVRAGDADAVNRRLREWRAEDD